eukprot:COSAG02_NODE_2684_length_8241_cov_14.362442_6_plen_178_part_00
MPRGGLHSKRYTSWKSSSSTSSSSVVRSKFHRRWFCGLKPADCTDSSRGRRPASGAISVPVGASVLRWAHAASRAASIASASSLGSPLWNESCRTALLIRCRLASELPITISSTSGRATVPVTHEPGPLGANVSVPGASGIAISRAERAVGRPPSRPSHCPLANRAQLTIQAPHHHP